MQTAVNPIVFVSAPSHRARARLYSRFPKAGSFYRKFDSKNKGPHYVYGITPEEFNSLKDRPIKGCGKVRIQDQEEYHGCISWQVEVK